MLNHEHNDRVKWAVMHGAPGKILPRAANWSGPALCVRARRAEENNIIAQISSIIEKGIDNLTEEDQLKLTESHNKLDEIYRRKAEGAFVRSRKKWLEEGEQNSLFLSLGKTAFQSQYS